MCCTFVLVMLSSSVCADSNHTATKLEMGITAHKNLWNVLAKTLLSSSLWRHTKECPNTIKKTVKLLYFANMMLFTFYKYMLLSHNSLMKRRSVLKVHSGSIPQQGSHHSDVRISPHWSLINKIVYPAYYLSSTSLSIEQDPFPSKFCLTNKQRAFPEWTLHSDHSSPTSSSL